MNPWLVAGPFRTISGYLLGRRQPSILVTVRTAHETKLPDLQSQEVLAELQSVWARLDCDPQVLSRHIRHPDPWQAWVILVGQMVVGIARAADIPIFEAAKPLQCPAPLHRHSAWSTMLLPSATGMPDATLQAWSAAVSLAGYLGQGERSSSLLAQLEKAIKQIGQMAPPGLNTPRMLRAAYERQIPVMALGGEAYQYGYGRKSQWIESTVTQATSSISMRLAGHKLATANLLRRAGLPVAAHTQVWNAEQAVQAASQLGYPVVVKPVDRERGMGVAAGLESEAEVRDAYTGALAVSKNILVEKHFFGKDYRLTVQDGRLIWAVERQPAGVTGDGRQTLEELVAHANEDVRRGSGQHTLLKKLVLDTEALELLSKSGLGRYSVPMAGQFITLRRSANVSVGGVPIAVMGQVHPDNALLAIRAAEALRLDIAGVDILISDIRQSWKTVGASICEVNARPQLSRITSPHIFGEVIDARLRGSGRVPVIVFLGAEDGNSQARAFAQRLSEQGICAGWCDDQTAIVGDSVLWQGKSSLYATGQVLLTHSSVEAVILDVHSDAWLQLGLPVDRFDWLVVAGNHLSSHQPEVSEIMGQQLRSALISNLMASCTGKCLTLRGNNHALQDGPAAIQGVDTIDLPQLVQAVVESLSGISSPGHAPDLGKGIEPPPVIPQQAAAGLNV